jgi:SAM-dependent methyltransferase
VKHEWFEANRALWNDRTPLHVASDFYGVEAFKAGAPVIDDYELAEIGEVAGKSLVHLQCHFGLDALDYARRGLRVVGVDLSERSVAAASALAAEIGVRDARFVHANVYDAVEALSGERFDIVYTGRGALNWLPDVARWAEVVGSLVKPGGLLYLNEFHPIGDIFDAEGTQLEFDYFMGEESYSFDDGTTYVETARRTSATKSFEWIHPVSEVISSLLAQGLVLELFREHDFTVFQRMPRLVPEVDGIRRRYRFPAGEPRLPLMYSIRMRAPARAPHPG